MRYNTQVWEGELVGDDWKQKVLMTIYYEDGEYTVDAGSKKANEYYKAQYVVAFTDPEGKKHDPKDGVNFLKALSKWNKGTYRWMSAVVKEKG